MVVQPTQDRTCRDASIELNGSAVRGIFVQGKVRSDFVVVRRIRLQYSPLVRFAEHNDVIHALADGLSR
jgi:hypothetical protein